MSIIQHRFIGGGANDPYWANVVLLMHFDSEITDWSNYANTFTTHATWTYDTGQFSNGFKTTESGGGYIDTPWNAAFFQVVDSDKLFTIEFWMKLPSVGTSATGIILDSNAVDFYGWQVMYHNTLGIGISIAANATVWSNAAPTIDDAWHHYAISRTANTLRFFHDGVKIREKTDFSEVGVDIDHVPLRIGLANNGTGASNMWLDDIRVTEGVCRYTANFTIPSAAFPNQ